MIKKILGVALALSVVFGITYAANDGRMKDRTFEEVRDTVCNDEYTLEIHGRFVENDTLFFLKEYVTEKGSKQLNTSAYLEPDRNSLYYMPEYWLSRIDGKEGDAVEKEWKRQNYYEKPEERMPLKKVDLHDVPTDWIPLHYLDGRTCVYKPYETDRQYRLTDSLYVWVTMEPFFEPMQQGERLSPDCWHFQIGDAESGYSDLYVHRIDEKTQASILELRTEDKPARCKLVIPMTSVKYFDLVVCDALVCKYVGDWKMAQLDAGRMLEAARRGEVIDIHHLDKFVVRRS